MVPVTVGREPVVGGPGRQAGITSFLEWFGGDQERAAVTADVFGTARAS